MKGKYTPGPWTPGKETPLIRHIYNDEQGRRCTQFIAEAFQIVGHSMEEVLSNAHLIAAAPEMLEAMQWFVDRVDAGEVRSKNTYARFKEIIAKALDE